MTSGVVKVALLATPGVAPCNVEAATLRFGPDGTEPLRSWQLRDVDGDGAEDLVVRFQAVATGIRCGDTTAALAGRFTDGRLFRGEDRVTTRGRTSAISTRLCRWRESQPVQSGDAAGVQRG